MRPAMATDPFEQMLSGLRAASDQNVAFYREHLTKLAAAYSAHRKRYDRDGLLNSMVKAMMESDNDREALCYQVVVALDMLTEAR